MALDPQYTTTGNIGGSSLTTSTANSFDGASGTVGTCFTAGANGAFISFVKVKALGANSAACIARFWLNNGGATTTASNNFLFGELVLPVVPAISATVPVYETSLPFNVAVPAGWKVIWLLSAAPTSAGWFATGVGGDY